MKASARIAGLAVVATASLIAGIGTSSCGIEGLVNGGLSGENELDLVTVSGTFTNDATSVVVINSDGAVVEPTETMVASGQFTLQFQLSGPITNAVVVASEGEKALQRLVPEIPVEGELTGLTLDASSTAAWLVMRRALIDQVRDRKTLDPNVARVALQEADEGLATTEGAQLLGWVSEVLEVADGAVATSTAGPFQNPALGSPIRPEWWAANGSDSRLTFALPQFETAVADAASLLNVIGCVDPDMIRVVFEADLGADRVDGQCRVTNGFAFGTKDFIQPDPGDKMFFTGAINEDSPFPPPSDSAARIQLDIVLGQFDPGAVAMFDDGTNGDEVAGDNIWTVTFVLPRGAYIQYKYTWGTPSEPWTGTEEWPGNERLLEIADVNGDNFVRRRDAFGDESTNKSRANECCGLPQPVLEFDPLQDLTNNGYPETREQPLDGPPIAADRQYDCSVSDDDWVTPVGIGPVLVECPSM